VLPVSTPGLVRSEPSWIRTHFAVVLDVEKQVIHRFHLVYIYITLLAALHIFFFYFSKRHN
jgi:hypothetical protein